MTHTDPEPGQPRPGPMPLRGRIALITGVGVPDDPARLIAWLATDAAWITGQTINTEGGFRCWT